MKIASDWAAATVGDVASVVGGAGFPTRLQGHRDLPVPFFKVSDMNRPGNERVLEQANNYVDAEMLREMRAKTHPAGTTVFPKVGAALLTNKRRMLAVDSAFDNNVMGLVPQRVGAEFLFYFMQTVDFGALVQPGVLPSVNGAQVASIPIRVPPVAEQAAICKALRVIDDVVHHAHAVLKAVAAVRALAHQSWCSSGQGGSTELKPGPWGQMPRHWEAARLGDLLHSVRRPCEVLRNQRYVEIGIRSHGKGVFKKDSVAGHSLGAKRVFWVVPGCIVFNIVFAWEGAVAVTGQDEEGAIASHRFPMFEPVAGRAHASFLRHLMLTTEGLRRLGVASPGGAGRNRTLNQAGLLDTIVPCPPIQEQRDIADALAVLDARIAAEESALAEARASRAVLTSRLVLGELRVGAHDADANALLPTSTTST